MAVQRHPVESFNKKTNFWEEFPDYKLNKIFGVFWKVNRKLGKLEQSSLFMWGLALCYDRKSSFFNQPEQDKWEVVSEDLFSDMHFLTNLALSDIADLNKAGLEFQLEFREYIIEFEKTIDTPLGMSLRDLERKLAERTKFIMGTDYTMDWYETLDSGKKITRKGTADQLDRMFRDTGKINEQVQKALDDLKASEQGGNVKGGGLESLGDGDQNF